MMVRLPVPGPAVTGAMLFLLLLLPGAASGLAPTAEISPSPFIAHAGGGFDNQTYTNSLEALNFNYDKGFRFFEVDFSWTSDNELVLIHDWQQSFRNKFLLPENQGIPTRKEFLNFKSTSGLTQIALEDVLRWARDKGDVFLVTDIKERNVEALEKIFQQKREYVDHLIPQVYSYAEYDKVKKIGYENIILTLYRMRIDPSELSWFLGRETPFALTMHWEIALSGLSRLLKPTEVVMYAHTVNDVKLYMELRRQGVDGIYTDFIAPP